MPFPAEYAATRQLADRRALAMRSPLVLWHLLSLDAPTVAVVWTLFVAHASHALLPPTLLPAMFLAVWLLYAADRLLDSHTPGAELEERHRFHRRHRSTLRLLMAAGALALVPLTAELPHPLLEHYFVLAGLLVVWFAAVHLFAGRRGVPLPKELAPALCFAITVFAPAWESAGAASGLLALSAVCFALLCALNCLFIHAWERPRATPHWTTRWALRHLTLLTCATALLAAGCAEVASAEQSGAELRLVLLAVALSALFLLALDRLRENFDRLTLRAAADLVLLSPLLLMPALLLPLFSRLR